MKPSQKTNRGFTLTEVLVVLAIIALLTSITLPVLQGAVKRARESTCVSNLKQIGYGVLLYRTEQGLESVYGRTHEMGLPPDGYLTVTKSELWCRGQRPETCVPGKWYLPQYPLHPGGVPPDEWETAQRQWSAYALRRLDSTVIFFDENHQQSCPTTRLMPFRAMGITLGVQLTRRTARLEHPHADLSFWDY